MKCLYSLVTLAVSVSFIAGCGAIKATDKYLPTDYFTVYRDVPMTDPQQSYLDAADGQRVVANIADENGVIQNNTRMVNGQRIVARIEGETPPTRTVVLPSQTQTVMMQQPSVQYRTTSLVQPLPSLQQRVSTVNLSSLSAIDVRTLQRGLKDRGYPVSKVDGILGPETGRAIVMFQRDRGLKTDAVASETLKLLGL